MIIVIDGPAGSGKSSTAKALARQLNIQFLDSGALYRAVTFLWLESGKPDRESFFEFLSSITLETKYTDDTFFVKVNGKDITADIRKQYVADHVSEMASISEIREFVNKYMRKLVKSGIFIADGRDLGTAVFPDADLKFYMDASLEERATRRYHEMLQTEPGISLDEVKENLKSRDFKDQNRSTDPLKQANDAIVIDTTGKTFDDQTFEMSEIIRNRCKLKQ